ncbi:MAG: hypothetical protein AB1744_13920, partial [Candidatus Zixiibacteriota bacterium]
LELRAKITVTNVGVYADDYDLTVSGNSWSTTLWDVSQTSPVSSSGTVLRDSSFSFFVRVIVPTSVYGDMDEATVTATSTSDPSVFVVSQVITISIAPPYICGDVDGSGDAPNLPDLTYLVAYLFQGGLPPPVMEAADLDGSSGINVADLTYLVACLFQSGPPPTCG